MPSHPSAALDRILDEIAERVLRAERLLFITGAGISADSGLPTYRGTGGLYDSADTEDGIPIETALSGQMFAQYPQITWKYLRQIEETCRAAQPNAAHEVIAALDDIAPFVLVYTQNIDGFHSRAGSKNVIEIHGSLHTLRCTRCRYTVRVSDYAGLAVPPTCPLCRHLVRPDVVLFGESLPVDCLARLERELAEGFDLVFSIGTSSLFPYIVEPVVWAAQSAIPTVEINPGETSVSGLVDYRLRLGAAEAMRGIARALDDLVG